MGLENITLDPGIAISTVRRIQKLQPDWSIFFLKVKLLCDHRLVFLQQSLHRKLQTCIEKQETKFKFCKWSIKYLILQKLQNVFWNCCNPTSNLKFTRNYKLNIERIQTKCQLQTLHL